MTTHDRWLSPPSSPTIVGRAVETIVWSSAARNMPSISAAKIGASARPLRVSSCCPFVLTPLFLADDPVANVCDA